MNLSHRFTLPIRKASLISGLLFFISIVSYCSGDKENPLVGPVEDDTAAPAKPALPNLTFVGNGEIHIGWTANTEDDIAGYKLYRAENDDTPANYTVVYDSTATEFKDKNLLYETTYFYRVSAYDVLNNESVKSDPVSGIPKNITPPGQPQNLSVHAQNIDSPVFKLAWDWNSESDLQGYKIYRGTVSDFTTNEAAILDSTASNSYTDINVQIDTVYYYKTKAYDKGGMESPASSPDSDVALSPPILLSPINEQTVSLLPTFMWSPVNNAVQYKVFIQTTSQGGEFWNEIVDNTQASIQYTGSPVLERGRTYFWKVATVTKDPVGLNSFSVIESFRIQ